MTLIKALETLKGKGIVKLAGLSGETNIDKFIDNARCCDEDAAKYAEQGWAKYHTEHADGHYIVETNGHHIIVTKYDGFDMATYGDYDTEDEVRVAFDEYEIMRQAEEIADEKVKDGSEMPRTAWVLMAIVELKAAHKAYGEAFERVYAIK
jgi:hypothetical protein